MKTMSVPRTVTCLVMTLLAMSPAIAEDPVRQDNHDEFRTLTLPASLWPQLDSEKVVCVVWEARDLVNLPLKYKGEIMAGTEGSYRQAVLERWVAQNKIDFTRHMLVFAFQGYEKVAEKISITDLKVTEHEVRGDMKTIEDKTAPSKSTVVCAILCPRHRRMWLYTGGPNPVYTGENGLLPDKPPAKDGK
jgi:hypothetical protein